MNLLDIPGEVLTHNLFPLLDPNDIVRLRRVCKPLKSLADDHLRLKVRNKRLLLVGEKPDDDFDFDNDEAGEEDDYEEAYMELVTGQLQECVEIISMKTLLNMECHLPVVRVALNLYKWDNMIMEDEYEDKDRGEECLMKDFFTEWDKMFGNDGKWPMKTFLDKYGGQITELKLTQLSVPMRKEKEIAFFEALPNLTRLTIQVMETKDFQKKEEDRFLFPETFKKLKHFEIRDFILSGKNDLAEKEYFWEMVENCSSLEVLVYPWFKGEDFKPENANLTALCYHYLGSLLRNNHLVSLKHYDMKHVYLFPSLHSISFADFCAVCVRCDVKLLNLSSQMFEGDDLLPLELENIGKSTVSLGELCIECFMAPFSNLEKLEVSNFSSSLESEDGQTTWRQFGVPVWPKLKNIDYFVNLNEPDQRDVSENLFYILFGARRRPTVAQLQIHIVGREKSVGEWEPEPQIPLPLKKWPGHASNCGKYTFMDGLGPTRHCQYFGRSYRSWRMFVLRIPSPAVENSAFVGKDLDKPVFLELKNLKKFSLLEVHNMRKITDTVFIMVFWHLKIQSFHLTSCHDTARNPSELRKIQSIENPKFPPELL